MDPDPAFAAWSDPGILNGAGLCFLLKVRIRIQFFFRKVGPENGFMDQDSVFTKNRIRISIPESSDPIFLKRWIWIRSIRIRHSSDHPIYQTEASRVIRTFILQEQDISKHFGSSTHPFSYIKWSFKVR